MVADWWKKSTDSGRMAYRSLIDSIDSNPLGRHSSSDYWPLSRMWTYQVRDAKNSSEGGGITALECQSASASSIAAITSAIFAGLYGLAR